METEALTAEELIAKLSDLPPDTVITWAELDMDRMVTYIYGIRGVARSGELLYGAILKTEREED